MRLRIGTMVLSTLIVLSIPFTAQAHMRSHHAMRTTHHAHHGYRAVKACMGTFMYMKGGKCLDARNKAATG